MSGPDPIIDSNHIAFRILKGDAGDAERLAASREIIRLNVKAEADEVALRILRRNRDMAFNEGVEEAAKLMERWITEMDEPGSPYEVTGYDRTEVGETLTHYAIAIRLLKRPTGDLDP